MQELMAQKQIDTFYVPSFSGLHTQLLSLAFRTASDKSWAWRPGNKATSCEGEASKFWVLKMRRDRVIAHELVELSYKECNGEKQVVQESKTDATKRHKLPG